MASEYLIRNTMDGRYLEALHPIRAKILYTILKDEILYPESDLVLSCLLCSEKQFTKILLLNFFIEHDANVDIITQLARIPYKDWESYAGAIDAMIWIDVQRFINKNITTFEWLIEEKGQGWICFAPLDISGFIRPDETLAESLGNINPEIVKEAVKIKSKFSSFTIDYYFCDLWLYASSIPVNIPTYDIEWIHMGYSLFWMSKRGKQIDIFFSFDKLKDAMRMGAIEYKAAAIQGLHSQHFDEAYKDCAEILLNRIITEYKVIYFNQDDTCVTCGFVPPILSDNNNQEVQQKSIGGIFKAV